MGKFKDLTGQRFGRWSVIELVGKDKWGRLLWRVSCDCGSKKSVLGMSLSNGRSKSCGCLDVELLKARSTKHGMWGSSTYRSWLCMKERCYNQNKNSYHNYRARGIKVCERWLDSFENFLEDMGERPKGMSIDRIDNNGHYTPENCRWANRQEQDRNKRTNIFITYNGETLCVTDWAKKLGKNKSTISKRHSRGWTPEECLFGRKNQPKSQEDS